MGGRTALLFIAVVITADILTKAVVEQSMYVGQSIPVISGFFSLTYVRNPGGAFGLFAGLDAPWDKVLFLGAATFTVGFLGWFVRHVPLDHRFHRLAVFSVISGAIGNMIDRFVYGEVVDFLDFYVGAWHWPAFNIADIAITLGVTTLVIISFTEPSEPDEDDETPPIRQPPPPGVPA